MNRKRMIIAAALFAIAVVAVVVLTRALGISVAVEMVSPATMKPDEPALLMTQFINRAAIWVVYVGLAVAVVVTLIVYVGERLRQRAHRRKTPPN